MKKQYFFALCLLMLSVIVACSARPADIEEWKPGLVSSTNVSIITKTILSQTPTSVPMFQGNSSTNTVAPTSTLTDLEGTATAVCESFYFLFATPCPSNEWPE